MRITSKGQVTIPIELRERLGLLPHTEVRLAVDGSSVRIVREEVQEAGRGQRLLAQMRGRANSGLSTGEIIALTLGRGMSAKSSSIAV